MRKHLEVRDQQTLTPGSSSAASGIKGLSVTAGPEKRIIVKLNNLFVTQDERLTNDDASFK